MPFMSFVTKILQICHALYSEVFPSPPQRKSEIHFFTKFYALSNTDYPTMLSANKLLASIKLLHHAEGNSGGAKLSHSLLSLTEELKGQLELDKGWLKNWLHFWSEIMDSLSTEWTSFCPLGQTPLPLQMLASGQSLSSTSGPGHWLSSSSLETGWPESRSKQARKRLWIETILLPLTTPAWEVLFCREAESRQGEHCVHSDHSLRITERKEEKAG